MQKILVLLTLLLTAPTWAQNVTPPNQGRTNSTKPTISANFNSNVYRAKVWVDGVDLSRWAKANGRRVTVVPPSPLRYGAHKVTVVANNQQKQWSFQVVSDNNNGNHNNNGHGNNGNNGHRNDNDHHDNNGNNNDHHDNNGNNGNNNDYHDNNGYNGNNNDHHDNNGYNGNNNPGSSTWHNNGPNQNGSNSNGGNYSANRVTDVSRYGPPAGTFVTVPRPAVSAAFNGPVQNLRLVVDGRDVTREATAGNEGISWTPRYNLDRGQHTAQVTGNAQNGQTVRGDWNFTLQY